MHPRTQLFAKWTLATVVATSAQLAAAQAPQPSANPATPETIDLNEASADELAQLPGIGPSKAEAIVSFRDRRPFRRPEDILRVRGIGRSTFRSLRDRISVSGTSRARSARRPAANRGRPRPGARRRPNSRR